VKACSITDTGQTRHINQDYVYCQEKNIGALPNLFIVADGMGGHNAGDYASRFSVEAFVQRIKTERGMDHSSDNRMNENVSKERTPIGMLSDALQHTNNLLLEEAKSNEEFQGMGTTFVVATIYDSIMYVANVGDSRLYVIKDTMEQVTSDHSLVEEMVKNGELNPIEAKNHPNKNIITRALGANTKVIPDYFEVELSKGDLVLMCSDGLTNMLEDEEILNIIKGSENNLEEAVKTLVHRANHNGGKDNISIIIIES
jgi:PPM family protein phosphatase